MSGPVETAAGALHAGCKSCDGAGTVRDWVPGGYEDVYQCESLAQLEDVLTQAFEALHAAGWRIVRTSLDEPYQYVNIVDEWTPEASR